ncbi:30S ribosomal protein S11 [Patescibacteria group bacterium]|nr:30S ribosomal protein S11 [Patescibacteria group bacterium]MBU1876853.1 30S ribosomal protein S11 [Patescibacteria group bacterium]
MGKKHVATTTKEELLKESDKIKSKLQKEVQKTFSVNGEGRVYIYSSYNNTILTLTDRQGRVLHWVTAGSIGFKGTKKGTPFAASKAAEAMSAAAEKMKIKKLEIIIKGIGTGREAAVRSMAARDFDLISITDVTPVPHNGCRPPKPRRV